MPPPLRSRVQLGYRSFPPKDELEFDESKWRDVRIVIRKRDVNETDPWTDEEEAILVQLHKQHGNKWATLSKLLPGRTENMIKNHWNATKRKKNNRGLMSRVLAEYISASTRSSVEETQAEICIKPTGSRSSDP
ncbi:Transcription factor MYB119-like protein [Drosera capensis]